MIGAFICPICGRDRPGRLIEAPLGCGGHEFGIGWAGATTHEWVRCDFRGIDGSLIKGDE